MGLDAKTITLECEKYKDKGLYIASGGLLFKLTDNVIEEAVESYWSDYPSLPELIREHENFQRCANCPSQEGLCDALKAISPLSKYIDKYKSFDKVVAIYKGDASKSLFVTETTMQNALQCTVMHSLTKFCKGLEQYKKYFEGILPTLESQEMAQQIYLNAYFIHEADQSRIDDFIESFEADFTEVVKRVVNRLRLVCENDPFLNAFVGFHTVAQFLSMKIFEEKLRARRTL